MWKFCRCLFFGLRNTGANTSTSSCIDKHTHKYYEYTYPDHFYDRMMLNFYTGLPPVHVPHVHVHIHCMYIISSVIVLNRIALETVHNVLDYLLIL